MKIRVYCEASVQGSHEGKRMERIYVLEGYISAPCLPLVGSDLWFLEDVAAWSNPATVTFNDTFHETSKGIFEPGIHVDWKIHDIPRDMGGSLEGATTFFEKEVLPGLVNRGWEASMQSLESPSE